MAISEYPEKSKKIWKEKASRPTHAPSAPACAKLPFMLPHSRPMVSASSTFFASPVQNRRMPSRISGYSGFGWAISWASRSV